VENLGELKNVIKARNPETLEKAVQSARQKEGIINSNREAKQY